MKLVEALKRVKSNKEKIGDLRVKIGNHCANMSFETPLYGDATKAKVSEWVQSATDLTKENVRLLESIQRTNLQTLVTIKIGEGQALTNSIAYWIWRRREYSAMDLAVWMGLGDRGLKEQKIVSTTGGEHTHLTIIRQFDPEVRDKHIAALKSEPHEIDAVLEVTNAITDLIE